MVQETYTEVLVETSTEEDAMGLMDVGSENGLSEDEGKLESRRRMWKVLGIQERHAMVLLCAICVLINYADRVNMSVAILAIGEEYNYSTRWRGYVLSCFFVGYLPMNLGGALLCRRYGGKKVLSYGAFFWSLFTLLTPAASRGGLGMLVACRVLMGLAEGVAFPATFHFLGYWVPARERGISTSVFLTGAHVGSTVALVVSPGIVGAWGWRWVFYLFGMVGLGWNLVWNLIAYDKDVDVDQVQIGEQVSEQVGRLRRWLLWMGLHVKEVEGLKSILTRKESLCICATQSMYGVIHYVILSWLPSYFQDVYHQKTEDLWFTFMPYFVMVICSNIGGFTADYLVGKGMATLRVRKVLSGVANIGGGVMIILFSQAKNMTMAIVYISIGMGFTSLNTGGFESCFLDMASPQLTGLFKAVANTASSLSGFMAIPLTTIILQLSASWRFTFASLSIWYTLLTIVFLTYGTSQRILT